MLPTSAVLLQAQFGATPPAPCMLGLPAACDVLFAVLLQARDGVTLPSHLTLPPLPGITYIRTATAPACLLVSQSS
jgi:hypothetical protein